MSRWAWVLVGLGALFAILAVALGMAAAVIVASTEYAETPTAYFGRKGDPPVPAWSRPCWRRDRSRVQYVLHCARVKGVIVYHEGSDPDGDGDEHAVAAAGARLVILKSKRRDGARKLPGVGHRVAAAGPVVRGSGGRKEIDVTGLQDGR